MANKQAVHPSVDIWRCNQSFKVIDSKNQKVMIPRNSLLFLKDVVGEFLVFVTESLEETRLHKSVLNTKKIERMFKAGD